MVAVVSAMVWGLMGPHLRWYVSWMNAIYVYDLSPSIARPIQYNRKIFEMYGNPSIVSGAYIITHTTMVIAWWVAVPVRSGSIARVVYELDEWHPSVLVVSQACQTSYMHPHDM